MSCKHLFLATFLTISCVVQPTQNNSELVRSLVRDNDEQKTELDDLASVHEHEICCPLKQRSFWISSVIATIVFLAPLAKIDELRDGLAEILGNHST